MLRSNPFQLFCRPRSQVVCPWASAQTGRGWNTGSTVSKTRTRKLSDGTHWPTNFLVQHSTTNGPSPLPIHLQVRPLPYLLWTGVQPWSTNLPNHSPAFPFPETFTKSQLLFSVFLSQGFELTHYLLSPSDNVLSLGLIWWYCTCSCPRNNGLAVLRKSLMYVPTKL